MKAIIRKWKKNEINKNQRRTLDWNSNEIKIKYRNKLKNKLNEWGLTKLNINERNSKTDAQVQLDEQLKAIYSIMIETVTEILQEQKCLKTIMRYIKEQKNRGGMKR